MARFGLSLSASLFLASAAAAAGGAEWRPETVTWTQPAGSAEGKSVESLVTAQYYALQAIKISSFDGRACTLQMEAASLNAQSSHPLDEVRVCEPKQAQEWQRADVGAGQFVTGISVCTEAKAKTGEIHGIQLWSASIRPNLKLTYSAVPLTVSFAHCDKWSPRRACPNGSIATGLRAQLGEQDIGAVGLALRCNQVGPSK